MYTMRAHAVRGGTMTGTPLNLSLSFREHWEPPLQGLGEVICGHIQIIINQNLVEELGIFLHKHLLLKRPIHANFYFLLRFGGSCSKSFLKRLQPSSESDIHVFCIEFVILNALSTLNVHFQYAYSLTLRSLIDGVFGSAVQVVVDIFKLHETVLLYFFVEGFHAHEMVFHSITLALSGFPCCMRHCNRHLVSKSASKPLHQCTLSNSRWAAYNQESSFVPSKTTSHPLPEPFVTTAHH
mmetsp:Transcript_4603/g.7010  ORF Transcript_4603/g.7010 Transcript_4603/m.7010 type:complete len:239 (+) Transcript_4603:40-756(+)